MDGGDLVVLAHRLAQAKRVEEEAKTRRVEIEEAIIRAVDFRRAEGQETFRRDAEHGSCSVTLKQPITTSVDSDAWLALRRTLPRSHPARGIFREKFDLDTKAARELEKANLAAWLDVVKVITRKPGKVSIEIKEVVLVHEPRNP